MKGGEGAEITLQTVVLVLLHVAPVDLSINVKTLRDKVAFS